MMDKFEAALKELDKPIPDKMKPIAAGLDRKYNANLTKQVARSQARKIVVILNTINSCTVEDVPSVIEGILDDVMGTFRKV